MSPPDDGVPPPSDNDAPPHVAAPKKNGAPTTVMVPAPKAGETVRQEFGASQVARTGETAATAVAAQARAAIESRYVMALQRPRDIDLARVTLLKSCERPRFAEVARYLKPIGKGVEGPSIRLAEEAARCMTNIAVEITTIYDDERRRIIRVSATDLEANLSQSTDVSIPKTVERNKIQDGDVVISQRKGSNGQTVYTRVATDDEILNTVNGLASKALRTNILRLVPADILEEAMEQVYATLANRSAADPDADRKRMVDSFAGLNIMPNRLKEYLGHDLDVTTPAEILILRGIYTAIKDGEATWAEVMDNKQKDATRPPDPPTGSAVDKTKSDLAAVAAASKARREADAKPPAPAEAVSTPIVTPARPGKREPRRISVVDEHGNEIPIPATTTVVKDGNEGAKVAAALGREPGADDDEGSERGDDPLLDKRLK